MTNEEAYAVAFQENNQTVASEAVFASEAQARDYMQSLVSDNPAMADAVHVIPQYEVTA